MLCGCLLDARVPLSSCRSVSICRGVVVFLCIGGKFVFVRVRTFRRDFCVEKWRGLRYGNFYVGGTNLGTFVCCFNVIIIYGECLFACNLIGAFGANF